MQVYFFPDCSCGQIDADLVLYPRDDKFSDPIVLPHDTADPPNYVRRAAPVRGKLPFGIGRPPQKPAKRSATGMKKQKETQGSGSEEEGEAPVSTASAASLSRNPDFGCIREIEKCKTMYEENSRQEFTGL